MWKRNKGTLIITSVVTLLPMVAGFLLWNRLPDTLATHWGVSNQPNGFSGKPFTVIGIPLILLALQWLCVLGARMDGKKHPQNKRVEALVLWIVPVLSVLMGGLVYAFALGVAVNVGFWCMLVLGLLFLVLGNDLPKFRPSQTMGIRISKTLQDPENWRKTHRVAGMVWVIGGGVMVVTSLWANLWVLFPVLAAMVLIPVLYSCILGKKKK